MQVRLLALSFTFLDLHLIAHSFVIIGTYLTVQFLCFSPYCSACLRSKAGRASWVPHQVEHERNLSIVARHNSNSQGNTALILSRTELSPGQLMRLHVSNVQQFRSYTIWRIKGPMPTNSQLLRLALQSGANYRQMSGMSRLFLGLGRFLKVRYLILTGAIGGGVAANQVCCLSQYFVF
jgi:hypothetical protein